MRDYRTPEEKLIEEARQHMVFYAGNLGVALKEGWSAEIVLSYRRWTAQACLTLGEFDQAAILANVPELSDLTADIEGARQAEAADDGDHCSCRHFIDGRLSASEPEKLIEVSSYGKRFQYLSKRYGQVVWLYKCALCNHVNAHPGPPDILHATGDQLKAVADGQARAIIKIAKGQPVNVPAQPMLADRNHFPNAP